MDFLLELEPRIFLQETLCLQAMSVTLLKRTTQSYRQHSYIFSQNNPFQLYKVILKYYTAHKNTLRLNFNCN